ncbi:TlpA disulfide reductase family protein [Cytophagales bacterium LB-30]|uniref:TlpA disulfide reductase family protein n=1 Tax=Shiella aurantiaca TaxID=3058365 RepID=A0ABT8F4Z9_9BACT|nr:TlpA disulfide reductase family protein [Shiella aurantiaca]MDN4165538.1 TlpA disulfide reductase family protein [Shiella aurantiaca]
MIRSFLALCLLVVLGMPHALAQQSQSYRPDSLQYLLKDSTGQLFQLSFPTPSKKEFRFSAQPERLVLIDVWATWCKPCIEAQPKVDSLVKQVGADKVDVVYLSIDTEMEKWKNFTRKKKWKGTHILADKKLHTPIFDLLTFQYSSEKVRFFAVTIPQYFFINSSGQLLEAASTDTPEFLNQMQNLAAEFE